MIFNCILDYEQVCNKLNLLSTYNIIKSHPPIGSSSFNLPIPHYSVGNGKNHIVLSGAMHGCELISTNFILQVMESIANGDNRFKFLKKNQHTLHFFPILNPEGYLISSSAVRAKIPRDMSNTDAQKIYNEYSEAYRSDDADCHMKLNTKIKKHQLYFEDVDFSCIPGKYCDLRNNIKKICEDYNIPNGTLQTWSSNGHGVDLNQNTKYNYKINLIKDNINLFSIMRYDNIRATRPGPIGCPIRGKKFTFEPEISAFSNFIFNLKHNKDINLCAYLNYHSTGEVIYQRPYDKFAEVDNSEIMKYMTIEKIYNRKISNAYSNISGYKVINTPSSLTCFNDLLRLQIPGNILIELSKSLGNPLGTFIEPNYSDTIEKNMNAVSFVLEKIPELYKIKNSFIKKASEKDKRNTEICR